MPIEQLASKPNESQSGIVQRRRNREEFWIRELGTLDRFWSNWQNPIMGSLFQRGQGSLVVTYALFNKHAHRPNVKHASGKHRARAQRRLFDPRSILDGMSSGASAKKLTHVFEKDISAVFIQKLTRTRRFFFAISMNSVLNVVCCGMCPPPPFGFWSTKEPGWDWVKMQFLYVIWTSAVPAFEQPFV